jgi:hypothetical protein
LSASYVSLLAKADINLPEETQGDEEVKFLKNLEIWRYREEERGGKRFGDI